LGIKLAKGVFYISVAGEDAVVIHLAEALGSGVGTATVTVVEGKRICVTLSIDGRQTTLSISKREIDLDIDSREITLTVEKWLDKCEG
jgi:hypothetical protein